MKVIDVHAHILPPSFYRLARSGALPGAAFLEGEGGLSLFRLGEGPPHPDTPLFREPEAQLRWMEENGVDAQVISVSPRLFLYELDGCPQLCRSFNDDIAAQAAAHPDRFLPMGTLPMLQPAQAVEELERIHSMGFRAVQLGTTAGERQLSDPLFHPVFAALERLEMLILLHPLIQGAGPWLSKYHLSNTVGNPLQTVQAAADMMFSGFLDRFPALRVLLVHGGGYLPYQLGRLAHGYRVRREARVDCKLSPEAYAARNFWFDGLTHSAPALAYLVECFGADRVLYGTDYPYDMADYAQLEHLRTVCPEAADRMAGGNLAGLLGL